MPETDIQTRTEFQILKADEAVHVVYGYAMISRNTAGELVKDTQGHYVEPSELEQASFDFISDSRKSGFQHLEERDAEVVASVVLTEELQAALGIAKGTLPVAWLIGVRVFDKKLFEEVKSGSLRMFSIQGKAIEEPVTEEESDA